MVQQHLDPEQIYVDHANICTTVAIKLAPLVSQADTRLLRH